MPAPCRPLGALFMSDNRSSLFLDSLMLKRLHYCRTLFIVHDDRCSNPLDFIFFWTICRWTSVTFYFHSYWCSTNRHFTWLLTFKRACPESRRSLGYCQCPGAGTLYSDEWDPFFCVLLATSPVELYSSATSQSILKIWKFTITQEQMASVYMQLAEPGRQFFVYICSFTLLRSKDGCHLTLISIQC